MEHPHLPTDEPDPFLYADTLDEYGGIPDSTYVDGEEAAGSNAERRQHRIEIITISDTDNDVEVLQQNLRLYGIVDKNGEWTPNTRNVKIIHTGDLINKFRPDVTSLVYMRHLKQTAPESCEVLLIAGNHEIEMLERLPFVVSSPYVAEDFKQMRVLHAEGQILFMHGYPTRELLYELRKHEDLQAGIAVLNAHYKQSVEEITQGKGSTISDFSYEKLNRVTGEKNLFRNIAPDEYYKKHGAEVSALLTEMGIEVVIHGHKPQKGGVQAVGEAARYMPGITLINNDCVVARSRQQSLKKKAKGLYGSVRVTLRSSPVAEPALTLRYKNARKTSRTKLAKQTDRQDPRDHS